jgi:hypothetical protein
MEDMEAMVAKAWRRAVARDCRLLGVKPTPEELDEIAEQREGLTVKDAALVLAYEAEVR